jgi:hypothetical protein
MSELIPASDAVLAHLNELAAAAEQLISGTVAAGWTWVLCHQAPDEVSNDQ